MPLLSRFKLFSPILAGATLSDRVLASLAALTGIAITGFLSGLIAGKAPHLLLLVPPMGASAVLLFAVPSSPMAQPWPTIGGNVISAFIGIFVGHTIAEPALAAGVAVGVAIAMMSLLRCLHPPGGAAALVAVFATPSASYLFPLMPIGLNAVLLVACAFVYHRALGRAYPHVAAKPVAKPVVAPTQARPTFSGEDVEDALRDLNEAFDISRDDLERLLREIEKRALARSYRDLTCADIMTRNVIAVRADASPHQARTLLAQHDFRTLPVVDIEGRVVGVIGQRQLERPGNTARELMSPPATATPMTPALRLIDKFTRDRVHAVYVLDEARKPLGVVTEADWLAVLTRGLDVTENIARAA